MTTKQITEELKNLIDYSFKDSSSDNSVFQDFHSELLRKYFDGRKIKIRYDSGTIAMEIPVDSNNFTGITFECPDLAGFLQACLRKDGESDEFYKSLLTRYKMFVAA